MYLKILGICVNIVTLIVLSVVQLSLINDLPLLFNSMNLVLVALIFLLIVHDSDKALFWSIGIGFVFDMYSFMPFGFYIVYFFVTIFIAHFLLNNFFTNRSLYTFLALTFFATIFFRIITSVTIDFWRFMNSEFGYVIFSKILWQRLLEELVLNLILIIIAFYVNNFLSNRLKPVFLIRERDKKK